MADALFTDGQVAALVSAIVAGFGAVAGSIKWGVSRLVRAIDEQAADNKLARIEFAELKVEVREARDDIRELAAAPQRAAPERSSRVRRAVTPPKGLERGFVHPLLAIALGALVTAGAVGAWSCSSAQRRGATTAAGALVDCTVGTLISHDERLVDLIRGAIRTGDWAPVRAAMPGYGLEVVGCTAAELVLQAPAPVSSVAPGLDPRAGFEALRRDELEGRRFKTASGAVL